MADEKDERDRFRPPDALAGAPLELARPRPSGAATDPDAPLPLPQPRKPVRYRRPRSFGATSFVVWTLAGVGAVVVGRWARERLGGVPRPSAPEILPASRTTYAPLPGGEAVLVRIEVVPRDARLYLDGAPASSNPLHVAKDSSTHEVVATSPGFDERRVTFTADRNQTIRLELPRAARR